MHSRIFLVRHGATVLTAEDRFAGATDVELSDEGREQVRRLADRLSKVLRQLGRVEEADAHAAKAQEFSTSR